MFRKNTLAWSFIQFLKKDIAQVSSRPCPPPAPAGPGYVPSGTIWMRGQDRLVMHYTHVLATLGSLKHDDLQTLEELAPSLVYTDLC